MLRVIPSVIGALVSVALASEQHQPRSPATTGTEAAGRPNVVVILTDDQDAQMDSLSYMAGVKSHLMDHGTTYNHHYCTVSLCCPSRVTMWSGKHAHNTNVTDLAPPLGQ